MATINITQSSMIQYYNEGVAYERYQGNYDSSSESSAVIEQKAQTNAYNLALSGGGGNSVIPPSGGYSGDDKYFGVSFGRKNAGTPYTVASSMEGAHLWVTAECYGVSDGKAYQLKLFFTLPNNVSSSLIDSATITINCSGNNSSGKTFALYAPKSTTNQVDYQKSSGSSIIEKKFTFSVGNSTQTVTHDLTDAFKQCIDKGQGWVTLGYDSDAVTVNQDTTVTVTSATITYTLKYTNCDAPTTISSSASIQKPGSSVNITWSGASAGNNMTISNYTIYWKVGGAPTTSSYTGSATSNSSPYSFTIPSGATRGSTYYFKIVTNGSISGYSSSISSAQATVKVNTLPGVPTVTVNKTRIPSREGQTPGGYITFTVTAGTDSDSQTKTVYYATSTTGNKTEVEESPFDVYLTSATTYYFWTYDELEYSSSYTSKSITVNIPPSIVSDFSMTAIATYSPSVQNRDYVKNIRVNAPTVTSDPAATLTYDWRFLTGAATSSSTPATAGTIFGHAISYNNLDVTVNGVGFNEAYKLQLTVTDDLGESATLASANAFCIPAAPTVVIYNQKANSNVATANSSHFGRYIRVKHSEENSGISKELWISTSNDFSSYNLISLTGATYTDIDLNNLVHGATYYFQIKYTCNSISTFAVFSPAEGSPSHPNYVARTRSSDITPQSITAMQQQGTSITPYTDTLFNISFQNQPLAFTNQNDVAINYNGIYSISLEYGGRGLSLTSDGSDSQGTVSGTCTLNNKTTSDWITFLNGNGSTSAPNTIYNVSLKVVVQNEFAEQFQNVTTISLDFIEGIYSAGNVSLEIQTGTTSWKAIPTSYRGLSLENRYPTFETQTLRISYSNLKAYANQIATIYFMNGSSVLGSVAITGSEWTAPSTAGNYVYTLSGTKYIPYTLPASSEAEVRNYSVRIVLANGREASIISTNSTTNNNLNTTSIHRFNPAAINLMINTASEDENNQTFDATWACTDFGGSIENTKYSNSYSTVSVQLQCCDTPNGAYTLLGNAVSLSNVGTTSMSGTGSLSGSTSSILYDIVYFGIKLIITLRFTQIDGATPMGTTTYTYYYKNQKVLYRATPNLVYGKNYFVLNATAPTSGITDQILELHRTRTRDTIYIGDLIKATLKITNDGLAISNFIIDSGTWDSN